MIHDNLLEIASGQQFVASGLMTSCVDAKKTLPTLGLADDGVYLVVDVEVAADHTTGDETYQIDVQTSANNDMSSATTIASRAIAAASLTANTRWVVAVPPDSVKQYIGGHMTLGGTSPSITITARFTTELPQDNPAYAGGI